MTTGDPKNYALALTQYILTETDYGADLKKMLQ